VKLKQLLDHWQRELINDCEFNDYLLPFRQNLLGEVILQTLESGGCVEFAGINCENAQSMKLVYAAGKCSGTSIADTRSISSCVSHYIEEYESYQRYSAENGLSSIFYQLFMDDLWLFRNLSLDEELLSVWSIVEGSFTENIEFSHLQEAFCDLGIRLLILDSFYQDLEVVHHRPDRNCDLVSIEKKIMEIMNQTDRTYRWINVKKLWAWYQAIGSKTIILLSQKELTELPVDMHSFYVYCARKTNTELPLEQLKSMLLESSTSTLIQVSLSFLRQGRALEAWNIIKQVIGISPHNAIARVCYAKIAEQLEQVDAVIEGLYSALEIWPGEENWHRIAASNLIATGHFDEASMHLEFLESKKACTSEEKISLTRAYIHQKAFNKAVRLINEIPEDSFLGGQRVALVVLLAIKKGDEDTANELFLELPCENDLTREVYLAMAEIKLHRGEPASALNIAQSAYQFSPSHAPTLILLGKCLIESGHMDDAKKILSQIQHDADTSIQVQRLALLKQIPDGEYYREEIEYVYEQYPDDPDICFYEAKTLADAGEKKKAMALLAIILQQDTVKAEHHAFAGWLHNELGNLDQAVNHLNMALTTDRSNAETILLLATVYLKRREASKALDAYQKGIQECSTDHRFYYEAGRLLREMKLYKDAEFMFRKATELAPDRKEIRNQLSAVMALNFVHNAQ
jgi:tetratricopeptide (TPR) repeat protein